MGYDELRYDQVRQKSVHNSFQKAEGVYDQVVYWRVRSLEVDVHTWHLFDDGDDGVVVDPETGLDDWFVYHEVWDRNSSIHRLGGFLRMCAGVQRALPEHEVITLFLDIKDGFPADVTATRSRARFDALLDAHLGPHLYRPADLLATDPTAESLSDAVERTGWPTLRELRGKFVIVLTGGPLQLRNYIGPGETAADRTAFVSDGISAPGEIGADRDIVIHNMSDEHLALAREVSSRGFVARAYYVNDRDEWDEAAAGSCHHVATDLINARRDSWSTTSGPTGFPFRAHAGPTPQEHEPGTVGGIWARSGDIWGERDSFLFHHRALTAAEADQSYEFLISGANSHEDDWTKGGIMARAGLDPGAPYLGIFRPGEKHGLRAQIRVASGGPTMVLDRHLGPRWRFGSYFEQDTLAYARLELTDGGRHAAAYGSIDGVDWEQLGLFEFDEPLLLHGLAVSSHGQRRGVKYLFVVPGGGPRPPFDTTSAISPDGSAEGWVDWDGGRRWRVDRFGRE